MVITINRKPKRCRAGRFRIVELLLFIACTTAAGPSPALTLTSDLAALCESAARIAARETGVPNSVMQAITVTETGRTKGGQTRPWPWTVNMEGAGKWFATPEEAQAYVDRPFDRGARSFDVGCFQINYRWHGAAFGSIEQMFDPLVNARYAAKFLSRLFDETGDWSVAAGAYHSRTPEFAERYRRRFDALRARFEDTSPPAPPVLLAQSSAPAARRVNTFPLLRAEVSRGRLGSLVPIDGRVATVRLVALE